MKKEAVLFIFILLGAFFVRLYHIGSPVADWHSWRQADTASVTRNFVQDGIDFLHPRFDDLSNTASGKDNPNGYRFVEFPLYNAMAAVLYNLFPGFSIEIWGRLTTVIVFLFSLIFLFLLVRKYAGERIGLLAAFFFAFLPYNIYYSRVILPDPAMVMAILGGIYFFDRWIEEDSKLKTQSSKLQLKTQIYYILAVAFTVSAFLLKPFALFFTLPMIYLAYRHWGIRFATKPQLWLFAIAALLPLVFWRVWIQQFPEGIPASGWLFNEGNIRFKGAFFHWIFAERIGKLILGYWGVALLVLGLARKIKEKEGLLFFSLLTSSLLYLIIIAGGNVKHDYYQILIVPTLAIFLAKGADFLLSAPKEYFSKVVCWLLFVGCCTAVLGFGWYQVRYYYNINNSEIIRAGKIVDEHTPVDAKVIAVYAGDSAFLYQTKRKGWPIVTDPIPKMIEKGASYLAIINPDAPAKRLATDYDVVYQDELFWLFKLQ